MCSGIWMGRVTSCGPRPSHAGEWVKRCTLPPELEVVARVIQEEHRARHPWEGLIADFLDQEIPAEWSRWDLPQRQAWRGGGVKYDGVTAPRARVCAAEIWCEALGKQRGDMRQRDSREINSLLERVPGWGKYRGRESWKTLRSTALL